MRLLAVVGTCAVLLAHIGGCEAGCEEPGAAASCVGPYLDDQPAGGTFGAPRPVLAPGESVTLHGHFYTSTCHDTGQCGPEVPLPDVTLVVTFPGGRVERLGPFTPGGEDLGFAATVEVPRGTPEGRVRITDGREPAATYAFRVRR